MPQVPARVEALKALKSPVPPELSLEANTVVSLALLVTKNAAEFLKAKDLGTLEKSKWADLVVLNKNPLDDIKNSRTIDAVYIAGNRVK